jgi:GNAT superfamily N-acetyltransferase
MLIVRRLSNQDSMEEITQLLHAAYAPLAARGMRYLASQQTSEKTLERCLKGVTFLAIMDETIVGTITLSTAQNTRGSPWYDRPDVASFGQFAVKPTAQKLGIGTLLLNQVEKTAKSLHVQHLALDTSEHAFELIRFYRVRGYEFVENVQWDVTNYRSVIMSKTL